MCIEYNVITGLCEDKMRIFPVSFNDIQSGRLPLQTSLSNGTAACKFEIQISTLSPNEIACFALDAGLKPFCRGRLREFIPTGVVGGGNQPNTSRGDAKEESEIQIRPIQKGQKCASYTHMCSLSKYNNNGFDKNRFLSRARLPLSPFVRSFSSLMYPTAAAAGRIF